MNLKQLPALNAAGQVSALQARGPDAAPNAGHTNEDVERFAASSMRSDHEAGTVPPGAVDSTTAMAFGMQGNTEGAPGLSTGGQDSRFVPHTPTELGGIESFSSSTFTRNDRASPAKDIDMTSLPVSSMNMRELRGVIPQDEPQPWSHSAEALATGQGQDLYRAGV